MSIDAKDALISGQQARLIPTVADSKKEERATSSLLASFVVVPAFAHEVLSEIGISIGKRSTIECYTEVCFKSEEGSKGIRPDGLIIITSGSKKWSAIVESKVSSAKLEKDQVEAYLDLARTHKIDAVITISNQYATNPTHHPLVVSKQKTRSVQLFHFSWLSIIAKAVLISDNKRIQDPEQAYILTELLRYFDHDSSGVTQMTRMENSWKDVCTSIQQRVVLNKGSDSVQSAVSSWQQLLKYLALDLSMKIGQPVTVAISKTRANDQALNFQEDCNQLVNHHSLTAEFDVPNAASRITLLADFPRRTLSLGMKVDAPRDRARATACINWLTRQLNGKKNTEELVIRANWPRRTPTTSGVLARVLEKPELLVPQGVSDLPSSIEIVRVVDLMARFKGAQTFVDDCAANLTAFYTDVGQHITRWVAKAPKLKKEASQEYSETSSALDSILEDVAPDEEVIDLKPNEVEEVGEPLSA